LIRKVSSRGSSDVTQAGQNWKVSSRGSSDMTQVGQNWKVMLLDQNNLVL
jgi:hypothetical protein